MTALVSVAASFWGKALCEYPAFLVNQNTGKCRRGRFSTTIFPITRTRTGQA